MSQPLTVALVATVPAAILTPGGLVEVTRQVNPTAEDREGYCLNINGQLACYVEYDPTLQDFRIKVFSRPEEDGVAAFAWSSGKRLDLDAPERRSSR